MNSILKTDGNNCELQLGTTQRCSIQIITRTNNTKTKYRCCLRHNYDKFWKKENEFKENLLKLFHQRNEEGISSLGAIALRNLQPSFHRVQST